MRGAGRLAGGKKAGTLLDFRWAAVPSRGDALFSSRLLCRTTPWRVRFRRARGCNSEFVTFHHHR
jgi:hypothetical protein